MKILVTGGSGFVGSHTALAVMAAGHEVVLLDDLSNSSPRAVAAIAAVAGRRVRFVRGDIRDAALLDALFAAHGFDAVLHLAAVKSAAQGIDAPLFDAVNTAGTVLLAERMAAHGVRTLVFSSTAAVYGDTVSWPITEEAPTAPASPYARSKLAAERALADLRRADPAWRISILRYFNVAGAHPDGRLGEDPPGPERNLLPTLAHIAAGGAPQLTVHGGDYPTRDGTPERDYVHVTDLAGAHIAALALLARGPRLALHNLGTGKGHTVIEVLRAFERAAGIAVPYRLGDRRPGDTAVSRADPVRAHRQLGWRARRDLAAVCADFWRFRRRGARRDPIVQPAPAFLPPKIPSADPAAE